MSQPTPNPLLNSPILSSLGLNSLELQSSARHTWYPLQLIALYRLFITALVSLLYFTNIETFLGSANPLLFKQVSISYTAFAVFCLLSTYAKKPHYLLQASLQTLGDIVFVVLLMHASGGLSSGLGILLVVNVAGAALLLPGISGIFFAAIATLTILLERVYSSIVLATDVNYQQAGAMGAALFGTAFLTVMLSRRMRDSEALATQRGLDIANLAQLNEQIIQKMQNGVLVVDPKNQVRRINQAALTQLGYQSPAEVMLPQAIDTISRALATRYALWTAEPDPARQRIPRIIEPGSPFELQPLFRALGPDGSAGTLVILEDVAPYTEELQSMKLASLGRLTASIAHEIRNPLAAIQHAAQLLNESEDIVSADARLTQIIDDQTRRMNNIVENVLQLSRQDKLQTEAVELTAWLTEFHREFCETYEIQAEQLDWSVRSNRLMAQVDPSQLHQIVWNLCSNSLKYGLNPDGELHLQIVADLEGDLQQVMISIRDAGKGIVPTAINQIFEPFYSGSSKSSGLGLYIVKELCEMNKGSIRYQQQQGVTDRYTGACFEIRLPIARLPK